MRFEIGKDRGQIAGTLEHRTRGLTQPDAHFGSDDVRQRRFAQSGRAEQQHMIERILSPLGGLDEDRQLFADLCLADIFCQSLRAQRALDGFFLRRFRFGRNQTITGRVIRYSKLVSFDHGNQMDGDSS